MGNKPNPATGGEFDCWSCWNYITMEHGGISCKGCGAVYCCDELCVKKEGLDIGQSQSISECYMCCYSKTKEKTTGQYVHEAILKFRESMDEKKPRFMLDLGQRKVEIVLRKILAELILDVAETVSTRIRAEKVSLVSIGPNGELIEHPDSFDFPQTVSNMSVPEDTQEFIRKLLIEDETEIHGKSPPGGQELDESEGFAARGVEG